MKRVAIAAIFLAGSTLAGAVRSPGATTRVTRRPAIRSVWDSVYTTDQATRGQVSYNQTCARCHLASLSGADEASPLTGTTFLSNWNGVKLDVMYERIRTGMPQDDPGTLGRQLIADVMAYMFKMNGFPPGAAELPKETDVLKEIRFDASKP